MVALMMVVFTGCGSKDDSSSDSGSGEQTEFQKAKASLDKNLKADEIDKDKCKGNSYGLILSSLGNEFWQTEREGAEAAAKAEAERQAAIKAEQDRIAAEQADAERQATLKAEQERIAAEQA